MPLSASLQKRCWQFADFDNGAWQWRRISADIPYARLIAVSDSAGH
jgi:hypothetical protein